MGALIIVDFPSDFCPDGPWPQHGVQNMPGAERQSHLQLPDQAGEAVNQAMIFRQMFDYESFSYTYLVAQHYGGEALIIDPVVENVPRYLKLIEEWDLRLVLAIDTHIHADHVTGLGDLRELTSCATAMGEQAQAECVTRKVREGEQLKVDGLRLEVMYTPGHTDDSYSFRLPDEYVEMMNSLKHPSPRLLDMAVPANRACGKIQAS